MANLQLSVDIGFGDTKYILWDEKNKKIIKKDKFPTAIEKVTIKAKDDKDVYNYGGKISYYRVGERALRNASITRDMDYLVKFSPLIVYHILKTNGIPLENELKIRTGVSLFYYEQYKNPFKNALKEFVVNEKTIKSQIKLFAQGQGILYDYLSKNKENEDNEIVVIDIGYNTIDFLHFIKEREKNTFIPFKENCFGINIGAFLAVNELKDYIEAIYDMNLSEQKANEILRTNIANIKGEKIDLSDVIGEIKRSYTDKIINDIIKVRKGLINSVDKVVLGGGGAYFIDIDEVKKHNVNSLIVDEPDFANVRGYLLKN